MNYQHSLKTLANGETLYKSTYMNTGGYQSAIQPRFIELHGTTQLRFEDIKYTFDIDLTSDTVFLYDASDNETARYGVGGTSKTNAQLNAILKPLFPKANSGNGGSGGSGVANATVADKTAKDALPIALNRLVFVTSDADNNSDTTLYWDNGTTRKYLLTVPQ